MASGGIGNIAFGKGINLQPQQKLSQSFGGIPSLLAGGNIGRTTTPAFSGGGGASPQSIQGGLNLGKGNTTTGLVNTLGQYTTATPAQLNTSGSSGSLLNPTLANSHSGGVNAHGQTLSGYAPSAQTGPFSTATTGLVNLGQNQPAQYSGAQNMMGAASGALFNSIPAQSQAVQSATQNLQNLQNNYAIQSGIIGNSPIGLSEQGGEQGLLNSMYANKLAAAQTAIQNALQGNAQIQSAYTGAGNIAGTQAGAATSEQQAQQAALAQAGSLTAPTPANIYGFYQPGTGQVTPYDTGGASGGGIGQGAMLQGTASLAASIPQSQNSFNMATGISDQFSNWLKNNPGVVNPSNINLVNELKNWAQGGQFSDPNYPELNQFINEYLNTASSLVGTMGMPTNYKQQIVNSMINPTSQTGSIEQQIANLNSLMANKLNTTYQSVGVTPPSNISKYLPSTSNQTNGTTNTGNTFGSFFGNQS